MTTKMTTKKTATKPVKKTLPKIVTKTGKVFILDTSVILHDPACIYSFETNDVILPIHVLEKLGNIKKDPNYNEAVEFCRTLDKLTNDHIFNGGVSLGPKHGKLKVLLSVSLDESVKNNLGSQNTDSQMISLALHLQKENPKKQVIIVSKDSASRLKAKAFKVVAQDYLFDKVSDIDIISQEAKTMNVSSELIDSIYKANQYLSYKIKGGRNNQNFILKADKQSALVRYTNERIKLINKDYKPFGIGPINNGQTFLFDALYDESVEIITVEGVAGSGKTLCSLAFGLSELEKRAYENVYYTRRLIEVGGESMGYLPGGVDEKMKEYMQPMEDNLKEIYKASPSKKAFIEQMRREGRFNTFAANFTRGRTISNTFIIVDEAQNLRPILAKTLISRAGKGTKIIFLGDNSQIDDTYLDKYSNGFTHTIKRLINDKEHVHIRLERCERSNLARLAEKL
jgi:PhoH-like ATPase